MANPVQKSVTRRRSSVHVRRKNKWNKVWGEFQSGKLKTSYGVTVTDPRQAMAISYSEARRIKK